MDCNGRDFVSTVIVTTVIVLTIIVLTVIVLTVIVLTVIVTAKFRSNYIIFPMFQVERGSVEKGFGGC